MQATPGPATGSFQPRQQRLAAAGLVALACLAMAWTLARHLPAWFSGPGTTSGSPRAAANGTPDAALPKLGSYALFGNAPGDAPDDSVSLDVPVTELALVLRGTVAARTDGEALAIIADADGRERTFRVGDELPGGATLERVLPDRVLIGLRGRTESLPLRDPERTTPPGGAGTAAAGAGSRSRVADSGGDDMGQLRRDFLANPAALADRVTLQPVQEDGEIVGMRVSAGISTALMGQLGLRETDVITEVNGVRLDSAERADEIVRQLRDADRLQVTLLRNGQTRQLTVPLGR